MLLLKRISSENFCILRPPPAWFRAWFPDVEVGMQICPQHLFPFLEHFVSEEASAIWESNNDQVIQGPGPWTQRSNAGCEYALEVSALLAEDQPLLLIRLAGHEFEERRRVLQKARERALENESWQLELEKREDFLRCLVHDLASPLTSIQGALSLIQHEVSEDSQPLLQMARGELRSQQEAIEQLLGLYKVQSTETKEITQPPHPCPVGPCIHAAIDLLAPIHRMKGVVDPIVDLSNVEQVLVYADADDLRRVIVNLLENAIRHSPSNQPVRVSATWQDDHILISITDQGSGVEAALEKELFDRFTQSHRGRGRAGIGLYFCRICTDIWGGAVGYQPGESGGSVFWVKLRTV